jgi:RNA polymerase subunit RPABC4/transcription elongation factor Spt4
MQSSTVRTCTACGNVIRPGDKYCSKCLVIVRDTLPQAAAPAPVVAPAPVSAPVPSSLPIPAPVMGQPSGVRTCNACGNIIKPGDKYCSKCLVIVRDNPLQAAAPAPSPVQSAPAAAPGSYVCASCGSPITGTEKFCGICGTTVVASRIPAPAQQPLVQKTCSACGAPVNDTTKFCGGCGAPVGASFRPSEVTPATAPGATAVQQGGEQVIGVIGNARKMKMLGASWDTYALVVTDRRLILAQLTADMLTAAYKEAAEKAKAEGKGFLEQMAHQMSVAFQYCRKYETLPPDLALAETKGNRAIENIRITAINVKNKPTHDGSLEYHEFIITVQSADGKFEFHIGEDERFITILKTAYGEKLHMPFGYSMIGGVRIKLF